VASEDSGPGGATSAAPVPKDCVGQEEPEPVHPASPQRCTQEVVSEDTDRWTPGDSA